MGSQGQGLACHCPSGVGVSSLSIGVCKESSHTEALSRVDGAGRVLGTTLSVPHGPSQTHGDRDWVPRGGDNIRDVVPGSRSWLSAGSDGAQKWRQAGGLGPEWEERWRPPRWALSPGRGCLPGCGGSGTPWGLASVTSKVEHLRGGSDERFGPRLRGRGLLVPEREAQNGGARASVWAGGGGARARLCVLRSRWPHLRRP